MIIATLLTVLFGGGLSAAGTFLLGFFIFMASLAVVTTATVLGIVLWQNQVPYKNKGRRAEDRA
jgi:hypothetical protein